MDSDEAASVPASSKTTISENDSAQENVGLRWDLTVETSCKPAANADYPDLVTDEDWARALIAGSVPADIAFPAIAYSCGFPVVTDDQTALFIHWYSGESWSVAGDLTNWEQKAMKESADGQIWSAEVAIDSSVQAGSTYKFVKNGSDWQADPWALRYAYDDNGEISFLTKPVGRQHMMRWYSFTSPQGLKSRNVYALVPANDGPYDVLYAHDGQNLFHDDGGYGSWELIRNMAEINGNFLIVGIGNTEDRFSEYTHVDDQGDDIFYTSKGDLYAAFVEETVRPFIESKFETTDKAGIMGSSLGGLISLYTAHKYPNRYKAVLALSPSTSWGRFTNDYGTTIKDVYVQDGHRPVFLYLDSGGYEPEGGCPEFLGISAAWDGENYYDNYCFTRDFVDSMVEIGYQFNVDLVHWFEPGASHSEGAWAARVQYPLSLFMGL